MHTNIGACGLFAAISGSSVATATTIGAVSLPSMRRHKYDERLALGSLAAGGTLGILIPPSIVLIVYGLLAETSIGQLYIAGVVPGFLMMLCFMGVIFVFAKLRPEMAPQPESESITWRDRFVSLVALLADIRADLPRARHDLSRHRDRDRGRRLWRVRLLPVRAGEPEGQPENAEGDVSLHREQHRDGGYSSSSALSCCKTYWRSLASPS